MSIAWGLLCFNSQLDFHTAGELTELGASNAEIEGDDAVYGAKNRQILAYKVDRANRIFIRRTIGVGTCATEEIKPTATPPGNLARWLATNHNKVGRRLWLVIKTYPDGKLTAPEGNYNRWHRSWIFWRRPSVRGRIPRIWELWWIVPGISYSDGSSFAKQGRVKNYRNIVIAWSSKYPIPEIIMKRSNFHDASYIRQLTSLAPLCPVLIRYSIYLLIKVGNISRWWRQDYPDPLDQSRD